MGIVAAVTLRFGEAVADSWCAVLAECYYVTQGLEVFVVGAFENAD